jgi:hypothetical protein
VARSRALVSRMAWPLAVRRPTCRRQHRAGPGRQCLPVSGPWDDGRMDEEIIPILHVEDAATAVEWYERLGFAKEWEHRFEPGLPAFVEVARGRVRLFLSEHEGDARPDTLVYLRVRDVDAIAAEFGVRAQDAPWAREIELRDPDGNRLRIGTPTG